MTTIERRTPCQFDTPNGVPTLDQTTFDRLHAVAGGMSFLAQRIEGIGGTSTEDPTDVADLIGQAQRAVELANDALDLAVEAARDHGKTWEEIGELLGISKQATWERFRRGGK